MKGKLYDKDGLYLLIINRIKEKLELYDKTTQKENRVTSIRGERP